MGITPLRLTNSTGKDYFLYINVVSRSDATRLQNAFLVKIEFSALLARQYKRDYVLELVQSIVDKVILLPNPDRLALDVALDTGCRAADLLYSFS